MWLQLEQLVLSHPPLFARKPLTNVFLGQLEISLCLCVSLSTHSQEHFSIFHFGTTSGLFNSSLTVPRADAPGGVHLQLLLSEHLNLATLGHPSATSSLGLVAFQTQISSEWWRMVTHWSISPHLVEGQRPTDISPQREPSIGAAGTNAAGAHPLRVSVAAVINVCVRCVTPLCVWIIQEYQLFCTHIWQNSHLW